MGFNKRLVQKPLVKYILWNVTLITLRTLKCQVEHYKGYFMYATVLIRTARTTIDRKAVLNRCYFNDREGPQ